MSRWRLDFTVDLIGEHERESEEEATALARVLYVAFSETMKALDRPGVLLPVGGIKPHPFGDPEK